MLKRKKNSWSYFSYKIKVFIERLLLTILNLDELWTLLPGECKILIYRSTHDYKKKKNSN